MSLTQHAMIALARSGRAARFMRAVGARTALAKRFVGGADVAAASEVARRLFERHGIRASVFYLGEYVSEPAAIERNVSETLAAVEALARAELDIHVSVDPTAIGFMRSEAFGAANALRVATAVASAAAAARCRPTAAHHVMMLDMEDLSMREPTCRLHSTLRTARLPAALTLEARRRRTVDDLRALVSADSTVRLVKGAFPETPAHDYRTRSEIDAGYLQAAAVMLSREARESEFHPVFGTHDDRLAMRIVNMAQHAGWAPEQFEFEMLYGVRVDWQLKLRRMGYRVRVYLPYGDDWWPYASRRVGENPRNAWLLVRSFKSGGYDID